MKVLVLLLFGALGAGRAGADLVCRTRVWAGPTHARALKAKLDQTPRPSLLQMTWGEILRPRSTRSVAPSLLHYLAATEPRASLRGYYKVLATSVAGTGGERRRPASRSTLSLPELCALYRRAGGG